jgi:hypothetical protein
MILCALRSQYQYIYKNTGLLAKKVVYLHPQNGAIIANGLV